MREDDNLVHEPGAAPPQAFSGRTRVQKDAEWREVVAERNDPNQALEYIQRAIDLKSDDPRIRTSLLRVVGDKLADDPFVGYIAETDTNYIISFRDSRPIVVPKGRAPGEAFPPVQRIESERELGMVWWLVLGLIPAGIGALLLSPILMQRAFSTLAREGVEPSEKRIAWLTIFLAGALGCLGELFTLLFILHWIG